MIRIDRLKNELLKHAVDYVGIKIVPVHIINMIFDEEYKYIENMKHHCHEIIEIYAGMDGFIPETAAEGYQQRIIKQMYREATKAIQEK